MYEPSSLKAFWSLFQESRESFLAPEICRPVHYRTSTSTNYMLYDFKHYLYSINSASLSKNDKRSCNYFLTGDFLNIRHSKEHSDKYTIQIGWNWVTNIIGSFYSAIIDYSFILAIIYSRKRVFFCPQRSEFKWTRIGSTIIWRATATTREFIFLNP